MGRLRDMAALVLPLCLVAPRAVPRTASDSVPRNCLDSFLPRPDRLDTQVIAATGAKIALGRMLFFESRLSSSGCLAGHGRHDLRPHGADNGFREGW